MLDNEPTDHQTTTEHDAGDAGTAPGADGAAPAKKATRKRAAKKTAAAPPPAPAKAARRTTKAAKTAKKATPTAAAGTDATGLGSTDPAATAPAKKTARKRASKKAAAARDTSAGSPSTDSVADGIAVLFQAPEVDAPRRRAASRPAGPPQAIEGTASGAPTGDEYVDADENDAATPGPSADQTAADERDSDDEGDGERSRRRRRRGGRGRRKRSDAPDGSDGSESTESPSGSQGAGIPKASETTDDANPDAGSDESPDGAGRQGGSGRGRRSAARVQDETDTGQDGDAGDDDADDANDEGEGSSGSRRRRRRRRRGGADSESEAAPSPDDPPNTVVRVRQGRKTAAKDEVVGVKGSTRLEAKRQRRREGRDSGRRRQVITESEFLARREAVERTMLVREHDGRTQIVVLEDGVLVEHYVARKAAASMIGNVYLGKVQNVLPSMEAAFVDIGKGRNAVLYAGEVNWDAAGMEGKPRRIELALRSGDPVLVQVSKDPVGSKGSRLTSQISLPGRYLVYVPNSSMTGISRKLPDTERARLKKILKAVVPDHAGVIVRTAAEGASEAELERDVTRLQKRWEDIEKRAKAANPPNLLHGEPDLTVKVIRDVFNEDFASLVVTGEEAWSTVKEYVDEVAPDLADRVSQWDGDQDLFTANRVDEQIAKALERKVWLPSGGSLVIDRTEAMTVVDVNTGKFVGSGGNLEETVTRNNLEAAEEIVRQLRLRDVGGIIVIDFIDMVLEVNRDLVLRRLMECLGRDRTKHQVAEVTSLGLVQMTRKRVGQGLLEAFSEPCEHCQGRGVLLFDEPVELKGGSDDGGGRGGRGAGPAPREQTPKKGPSQAQKVHEAARKAQEKAEQERAKAQQDGQQVTELDPAEVEIAPAGAETAPVVEPAPADVSERAPLLDGGGSDRAGEPAPLQTEAAPPKRRRRRATSPSTTPASAPPA